MKLFSKKNIILGVACALAFCGFVAGNASISASANKEIRKTTDLFLPSEMNISHSVAPEGASSLQAGVMFTTESKESTLQIKNKLSGTCSYLFEPVLNEGVITLNTFETSFVNEDGKSFVLRFSYSMGESYACIVVNETQAGIVYSGKMASGNTRYANSVGVYTSISQRELSVVFDAEEMQVFVGEKGSENLVWDLSESENDGNNIGIELEPFDKYSVAFAITSYQGDSCSGLLREINGCALNGITLANSGNPQLSVKLKENGVVGEKYTLPSALATDIWDGELKTGVKVFDPNGKEVANNTKTFIPVMSGEYTVAYFAENSIGTKVEQEYPLMVFPTAPSFEVFLDENVFEKGVQGFVGDDFYVPLMMLTGGRFIDGFMVADVTIKYNGTVLSRYNGVESGFVYTFKQAGKYEFVYDIGNGQTKKYALQVVTRETELSEEIKEIYEFGELVDLRNAVMIVNNETKVECSIQVEYPDGSLYQNSIFECTQIGLYKIVAVAQIDGITYFYRTSFTVSKGVEDMFEYNSNGVNAEYGKSTFTDNPGVLFTYSKANIAAKYAKEIDLSTYVNQTFTDPETGTVSISEKAKPLVSFSIDPAAYGVAAATTYYLTLTDVEDPSNTISVLLTNNRHKLLTYIRAKAGNQSYVGFNNNNNKKDVFHGEKGEFFTTSYGFQTKCSFTGDTTYLPAKENFVTLYYDNEEKQLLAKPDFGKNWIICDFDDPGCCIGNVWQGFLSNKAYLSLSCGAISGNSATIALYQVDGISLDEPFMLYNEEPIIELDRNSTTGVKGYSVSLPKAVAYDKYGEILTPTVKAYYYFNGSYYDVKIKNGTFQTLKEGTYVIVYTAEDAYGNVAQKEIEVEVFAETTDISLDFNAELEEIYTNAFTGVSTPIFADFKVENHIGEYTTITTVTGPKNAEIKNGKFIPTKAGKYTVSHTVTDSLGRVASISYSVTVELEENPIATTAVPLYYGFIRGNSYKLYDVYAMDYSNPDNGAMKADIYVNGKLYTQGTYTPEELIEEKDAEEKAEFVSICYKLNGKTVYSEGEPLEYSVPVKTIYKKYSRKVGTQERERTAFLLERYFIGYNGMQVDVSGGYVALQSTKSGATANFVQPVAANGFSIKFDITDDKIKNYTKIQNSLSYVKVILSDSIDKTKQIEILVNAEDGRTVLYVNGNRASSSDLIYGSLFGDSKESFEWRYDAKTKTLTDVGSGATIYTLLKYASGAEFEGFSNTLYISFEIGVAEGKEKAGIFIQAINRQNFLTSRLEDDSYAPYIQINGTVAGTYEVGENFVVPSVAGYDVLSNIEEQSLTVTVTRITANGSESVKDINGLPLSQVSALKEYTIKLDVTGTYTITYNAKDSRQGVMPSQDYNIIVRVTQEPKVEDVELQKTVKQGQQITVPVPEVSFSEENENNIFYIVYITPDNRYQILNTGEKIIAEQTGNYRIRYLAIDSYGNYLYKEYIVISY